MKNFRRNGIFTFFFIILTAVLFPSCEEKPENRLDLRSMLKWAPCTAESSIEGFSEKDYDFQPMTDLKGENITKLTGSREGAYIFIAMDFTLPESLKDKDLSLIIPYLHFADEVWLNGHFIGSYGTFPPRETSVWFSSQDFDLSQSNLNQDGNNTILIKVWSHGKSKISPEIFIGEREPSLDYSNLQTFHHTKLYIFLEGILACAFILYLFLFFRSRRKNMMHLSFAFFNFFTMLFLSAFWSPEMPVYSSHMVSNLTFMKITLCVGAYCIFLFITFFILAFLEVKPSESVLALTLGIFIFQVLMTIAAPTYNDLMKICPIMLVLVPLQMYYALFSFVRALCQPANRKKAVILIVGFAPSLICIVLDVIIRMVWQERIFLYFSIVGWQFSIFYFLMLLTRDFYNLYYRVELLNTDLEKQVLIKTHKLSAANIELENIIRKANADLTMASIVQQKFFPSPNSTFRGWDVSIFYKPLAEVSGDLYDYYASHEKLNGISLFDVSGHGLAASLITMLAKDIISHLFAEGLEKDEPVSVTLRKFNDAINDAKGDVENYLTGLLFRFDQFDSKDRCHIQLANAGHPYPVLYSAKDDECSLVKPDNLELQYGSIGIRGLDVSFQQTEFTMAQGDILVCFTDCLIETTNQLNEQFQNGRIRKIVKENASLPAYKISEALINGLNEFRGERPLEDDLTIIVLKRDNSNNYVEELYNE